MLKKKPKPSDFKNPFKSPFILLCDQYLDNQYLDNQYLDIKKVIQITLFFYDHKMQFVQEFGILDAQIQQQIIKIMKADERPFEPSMIYDSIKEEKYVSERRISVFKTFVEPKLFKLCDQVVQKINQANQNKMQFILCQNDMTYIKYATGGFFKRHADYLSLTSNMIEEYTLIMCVDAQCQGGETILHFNQHFKYPSQATTTPLHFLLFRKDISHEGAIIKQGYKEIMTLNLWGINEDQESVVLIDFTKIGCQKNYLIPFKYIESCPDNVLKTFLNFKKRILVCDDNSQLPKIVVYQADVSYEDFAIINKIYQKQRISYDEYFQNREIIDYFGFDWKNLLIKDITNKYNIKTDTNPSELLIETEEELIAFKSQKENKKDPEEENPEEENKNKNNPEEENKNNSEEQENSKSRLSDDDLVLCGTFGRYLEFLNVVKKSGLEYVPFKIIFAEGGVKFGEGWSYEAPVSLKMTPLWSVFSEQQHLYNCHNVAHMTGTLDVMDIIDDDNEMKSRFDQIEEDEEFQFAGWAEDADDDTIHLNDDVTYTNISGKNLLFNLRVRWSENNKFAKIIETLIDPDFWGLILATNCQPKESELENKTNSYYIDDHGRIGLLPEQVKALKAKIEEVNLFEAIKSKLNQIQFALPQVNDELDHSFCNESIYGNFKFVLVYGFLKMDSNT